MTRQIDGTRRSWGHFIEPQWGTSRTEDAGFDVHGCLTPAPKVGDTVKIKDGVYEFTEVVMEGNPRDLFRGHVKPIEFFDESMNESLQWYIENNEPVQWRQAETTPAKETEE